MANYDDARAEREFRNNPPSTAPGQGSDDWGDIFEGSSSVEGGDTNAFSGGDLDVNSILNNQNMSTTQGGQSATPQMPKSEDEMFFDLTVKFCKFAWNLCKIFWKFFSTFVETLTNNTSRDWSCLGSQVCLFSAVVTGLGCLFLIMKTFVPSINDPFELISGGLLGLLVGIPMLMFNSKEGASKYDTPEQPLEDTTSQTDFGADTIPDFDFPESDEEIGYDDIDEQEEDCNWDDILDQLPDEEDYSEPINQDIDLNQAIDSIKEIPAGTQTRQYLFETFTKVLPLMQPNYAEMVSVPDGSDEFMMFEGFLRDAAYQAGTQEEKIPELQEVKKNLFIIQLIATRPVGIKEEEIANYVADSFKRDENGFVPRGREGIYASTDSRVGTFVINIFLCSSVMFSLGDVYKNIKDFVLDPKVTMPLVWGVNEFGQALYFDGGVNGTGNMLISGEGRSGKSWKGQSLIAQMSMFLSPEEVNFYFFDVKGTKSDYYYLSNVLPHAKGFCTDATKFAGELRRIVDKESKRRDRLFGECKCNNIKDYNKLNPNNKLPFIYFVIDEMAAAMGEMVTKDKESKTEFNTLLISIITKYPYFGYRVILFPHRITNDIIDKTVSTQISCRAVMGVLNAEELKSALGIDPRKFQYSLIKAGDIALKTKDIANGIPCYCHAEVLSSSDFENRKIFDFISAVWNKLVPDSKTAEEGKKLGNATSAKDNTTGKETYNYSVDADPSNGQGVDSVFDDMSGEKDDEDLDDFWDSLI